jgi:hypothetical protein
VLGYCGIDCKACPAYEGTITTNPDLLRKSAGSFWDGAYSAAEWVCLGCTPADQQFLAKFCSQCKIRVCAIGKGIQNCAACDDYDSCPTLHEFIKSESEAIVKRMAWLRARFTAQSVDV